MTKIHVLEFVARLKDTFNDQQQRVTWLLGAGCSVSSGIPTAGGMVRSWVRQLHTMQGTRAGSFDYWAKAEFSGYTDEQAGRFYARAFHRRYPSPLERQRAIEMFCARARPGYGYATFAQILSHEKFGRLCNTVLTTNFDDLVADALYLHGALDGRPQVIAHEAVTHFARISSPRPTVIKLHGDAHLDPKNTETETKELPESVCRHLYPFLNDSALIFIGYSGGDESIAAFLGAQPVPALAPQIYWIGSNPPSSSVLTEWLVKRGALHVDHQDFDLLMHLLRGALEIAHPKLDERMKEIGQQYHERLDALEKETGGVSDPEEKAALEKASKTTEGSLSGIWALLAEARRQQVDDPDAAERTYARALKLDNKSDVVLNSYALFLKNVRKDMDRAEAHYQRAIEVGTSVVPLVNYGYFLNHVRKDMDRAEAHYLRAIEGDPKNAWALVHYARFLHIVRNDMDRAERHYQRAINADPKDAAALVNYSALLAERGDFAAMGAHLLQVDLATPIDPHIVSRFHFLRYAHLGDTADDALRALSHVLPGVEPLPDLDLTPNIERARADGHPNVPLLKDLARVLKGEASMEVLESHPAWLAGRASPKPPAKLRAASKKGKK